MAALKIVFCGGMRCRTKPRVSDESASITAVIAGPNKAMMHMLIGLRGEQTTATHLQFGQFSVGQQQEAEENTHIQPAQVVGQPVAQQHGDQTDSGDNGQAVEEVEQPAVLAWAVVCHRGLSALESSRDAGHGPRGTPGAAQIWYRQIPRQIKRNRLPDSRSTTPTW